MNLLYRIVYAAHAKGTHHKLALDALRFLKSRDADRWQRLFLKHAELFMQGAKAPDDEFKDFKNHVLHTRDGYWGGAPDKVQSWYGHVVTALKEQQWSEAVWAAGVLSHYYTDPIQPFHTAQSEAENAIHRAAEWSISKSYDALFTDGEARHADLIVMSAGGENWLRELVCQGADKANPHYEKLIAHYDIHKGVVDPPAGLDTISRAILADLLIYAAKGLAFILDRAIAESAVSPPEVSLTLDTILAGIKIPAKMLAKRLADGEDRRIVEAMYDELKATGRVEATLPEDDRVVRALYEKEIAAPQRERLSAERSAKISGPVPHPKARRAPKGAPPQSPPGTTAPAVTASVPALHNQPSHRHYLASSDDVERAPSIGPRLAERLAAVSVRTVAELLVANAGALAEALGQRHITAETIADWQSQSRLLLDIPGLRGTHAQLLVGSGYRTRDEVADADRDILCAHMLSFATTEKGRSILRDGTPPDVERIKLWLEAARVARAA